MSRKSFRNWSQHDLLSNSENDRLCFLIELVFDKNVINSICCLISIATPTKEFDDNHDPEYRTYYTVLR